MQRITINGLRLLVYTCWFLFNFYGFGSFFFSFEIQIIYSSKGAASYAEGSNNMTDYELEKGECYFRQPNSSSETSVEESQSIINETPVKSQERIRLEIIKRNLPSNRKGDKPLDNRDKSAGPSHGKKIEIIDVDRVCLETPEVEEEINNQLILKPYQYKVLRINSIIRYKCKNKLCTELFTSKDSLSAHIWRNHTKNIPACQHCGEKFISRKKVREHVEQNHLGNFVPVSFFQVISKDKKKIKNRQKYEFFEKL